MKSIGSEHTDMGGVLGQAEGPLGVFVGERDVIVIGLNFRVLLVLEPH